MAPNETFWNWLSAFVSEHRRSPRIEEVTVAFDAATAIWYMRAQGGRVDVSQEAGDGHGLSV
jgi:hypothetical protein